MLHRHGQSAQNWAPSPCTTPNIIIPRPCTLPVMMKWWWWGGGGIVPYMSEQHLVAKVANCKGKVGGVAGGGFGMTPWCDDLVCSWRRLLADRHWLPFPWTLSLHRRWCPSASHHPLTFLFLLALTFPLPSPFPSLGLSLCRPPCPSASPHSFPSLTLGRLCQRSPRTCPVSLLCVESTQRKANAIAVGQVRPSGHPKPAVRYLSPTAAGGPWDGHLRGRFPDGGT